MNILPFYPHQAARKAAIAMPQPQPDSVVLFSGNRDGLRKADPLDRQIARFVAWADEKRDRLGKGLDSYGPWDYHLPPVQKAAQPGRKRQAENRETLALFKQTFPTFLWTGIECSNPLTVRGERWDELAKLDFYNPEERRRQVRTMRGLGIQNVRLGMPNHKIAGSRSWAPVTAMLRDFKAQGAKISLDLQHFGLPDHLTDPLHPERSQYLNPAWPAHFARFAKTAVERYSDQLDAITIINEPLITNNFSGMHWNEGFPGHGGHPEFNKYFVERALLIAEAAVNTRFQTEEILQRKGQRKIFIHNESCENRPEDPGFNEFKRFLTSDLILGQDWLLRPDFTETPMYRWMESQYVRKIEHPGDERLAAVERRRLLDGLNRIRDKHLAFQKRFGKTMKADTVFGIDFYATCEGGSGISGRVEDYPAEVKAGKRKGLYGIGLDYYNHYQLPVLHTETNMGNELGSRWGMQQLLELAQLEKSGVPVLGFTWYSLMDQYGWERGLSGPPQEAQRNHIGLVSPRDYDLRRFAKEVLPDLRHGLEYRTYPGNA